ncbi:bifunctional glutamate N-acetyltransferase/amino-acid acetyltransferase ArgJ [candidate division KSB1 bacterium]|nr:bifunctional glutamate N-acetyltransferase/amino-acid acetyltransferase ArgJ [candidate division KSB1 bacterium]
MVKRNEKNSEKRRYKIKTGSITTPKGFAAAGIHAGLKESTPDLALIKSDCPATVAAVFTTNTLKAAPILFSQKIIRNKEAQAIVINSGVANACTGQQGLNDCEEMAALTAKGLDIDAGQVLIASTGVIGEYLPMPLLRSGIERACRNLSPENGAKAAQAILTTDTKPKHKAVAFRLQENNCTIGAISKGSGMIQPNMATMISILTTDVAISADLLQKALYQAVNVSYNRLTIDGEMSTNDCVFCLANGLSGNRIINKENQAYDVFLDALNAICLDQTRKLAADGEGATKSISVTVTNARTTGQAEQAARAVANSQLVKTAIYGEDPNWGRVISAIGSTGVDIRPDKLDIWFADIPVAREGAAVPYDTKKLKAALKKKDIKIHASLGTGTEKATIYTCDLTHKYIEINAEYHT